MNMYEKFKQLLDSNNITPYRIHKETGISTATLSDWKNGKSEPKKDKIQKICTYFDVPVSYFYEEEKVSQDKISEKNPLTTRDEKDIAKDLDRIMNEIRRGDDGPLYYNGVEIDSASLSLLENAINFALCKAKKENKVKYNPLKNKK